MTKKITRRKMLETSGAAAIAVGAGVTSANAALSGKSGLMADTLNASTDSSHAAHDCAELHDVLAQDLARTVAHASTEPRAVNMALRTTQCPHCATRIGLDTMHV